MSTRERILTIRLMERISNHLEFAEAIGIECIQEVNFSSDYEEPP